MTARDDDVMRELTAVKGIGAWSAHMFLMFTLHRPDVLAVGDLGIRNAVRAAYGLTASPKPAELEAIAEPWRPYRTRACLYLWRSTGQRARCLVAERPPRRRGRADRRRAAPHEHASHAGRSLIGT